MMPFEHLAPHRRLIAFLEMALDCLDDAVELDATLGVLPFWAKTDLRVMGEDLQELFDRVARESPALAPLSDDEAEGPDDTPRL